MSRFTPIRLYGPRDLARIEERARQPLREWAARWLVRGCDLGAVTAGSCLGDVLSSPPLRCVGQADAAWLGVACFGDIAGGVALGLFGAEPGSKEPLGATLAVAESALHELSCCLLEALTGQPGANAVSWMRHTGAAPAAARLGEVELCIGFPGGHQLCVVLGVAAAMACLGRPAASTATLSPRHAALDDGHVRLDALLAPVELPLAELLAIRAGDVVLFAHRLDEPVLLRTAAGKSVGRAALGARDGRRAARLIDSE